MAEPTRPAGTEPEEDWVPADDAVIGRALRISLLVIAGLLAVALGVVLMAFLLRPDPEGTDREAIAVTPPEEVSKPLAPPQVPFDDVAREVGIEFIHENGARGDKLLPETMGGGVAVLDYDNDGDQDLFFVNSDRWPDDRGPEPRPRMALYENDGTGQFVDVSHAKGVDLSFYGTGVAVGDYDNDGDVDLFLAAVGPNHLLRNEGAGESFTEVTGEAGVAGSGAEWSSSSGFFDYDNDGDLDLFVGNYVRWSKQIDLKINDSLVGIGRAYGPPVNYEGTFPYLYRNDGDGTFTDVSQSSGIKCENPATGAAVAKSLGLAPVDVDRDGWMDLFVANDTVRNFLFRNRGNGTFEESGEVAGVGYGRDGAATGAMGADSAYYRNDSQNAFVVANFANEMSSLYVAQGDPTLYADESIVEGLGAPSRRALTFGVFFFDYDLDGRLDLLQANGHLEEEINKVDPSQRYRQPTQLFWNGGPGGLVLLPQDSPSDLSTPIVGRGAAYGDLDGDADLDVVVLQTGGPPLVLRNGQQTANHWLRVKLVGNGVTSNRDAIGAWIELRLGGETLERQVMPTRSYQSQVELPVTFGLGERQKVENFPTLRVVWPGGETSEHPVPAIDRVMTIAQPVSTNSGL